ncbi:MAG: dihydroorotase [Bdellovibrionota bacterium]
MNLLLRNVALWNADRILERADVRVRDGKIVEISEIPLGLGSGETERDAAGAALLPAGVDLQVHLRVPGQPQKETAETGLLAARKGGYAAILTMPNTKPVIDTPEILEEAKRQTAPFEKATGVRVLWSVAMTFGQGGEKATDAVALKKAGAVALTDDGVGVSRDDVMEKVFRQAELSGLPLLQHAEVPGHGGVLASGPVQKSLGLKAYPADAEWKMVDRDLKILSRFKDVRYHVLHVSASETLEVLKRAQRQGLMATGEATPHHLHFSSEDIVPSNTSYKMNPPIRSAKDRDAIMDALVDGTLAFVSTDHAPHESELKGSDFSASAYGTTGLETSLRVLLDLQAQGKISARRLVEVFSTAPADFIGVGRELGVLEKGRDFKAVLVDPKAPATKINDADLASLSHNNIFLGVPLRGRILEVFL